MSAELVWKDEHHALGVVEMDDTHRAFLELLAEAVEATAAALPGCLERLATHTAAHFARESELMRACQLASSAEHEAEHARVLAELAQMQSRLAAGRVSFVRMYLAEGVPDWFRTHLATMDSALAADYRRACLGD